MIRRQKRIEQVESKAVNRQNNGKPVKTVSSNGGGFYYSFMTVILILCLIQITVSLVLNVSKIVSYHAKIIKIKQTKATAMALNEQLKDNIRNFSNVKGLEAIARNNLKMSGEDEVLVIINTPQEEEKAEPKNKILDAIKHIN